MGIPQRFRRIRNVIAEKLISTSYLEDEKREWQQQLIDALKGEFENNEEVIVDATEELEKFNRELAHRNDMNVYEVKYRFITGEGENLKCTDGSMSVIENTEQAAINKAQEIIGLYVTECVLK